MNLLGIDVGTTGCKVVLFTLQGEMLASAYREYNAQSPQPGWAELDALLIWEDIKSAIRSVMVSRPEADVQALSVSSLGESVVPVSADRRILGPSLLNFDRRGEEFIPELRTLLSNERLYVINGNPLGNLYSLTKLKWVQTHQPDLYASTYKFLHWSAFVAFMLGAEARVDFSLANRTLLFDIRREDWSEELLNISGLDREKLPATVPSGTVVGTVSAQIAAELGLPPGVRIVSGAHDQCANAVGCGVVDSGSAVYGMGTYHCITPVFPTTMAPQAMIERGLNTEHHAIPGQYVCFIYNQGGALVKWYRDTFAAIEHHQFEAGEHPGYPVSSIYPMLLGEVSAEPSSVLVLPHFAPTGPPEFISDSSGVMVGLHLGTKRGDILKGILEGITFYLKEVVDALPATGIQIKDYRVVGGGSRSNIWVQTCANILGKPFTRPVITEAGALGAAIMAGVGTGIFDDFRQGVAAMVKLERTFEPDPALHQRYQTRYQQYQRLWPLMVEPLRELQVK
jgi:xylulokinase